MSQEEQLSKQQEGKKKENKKPQNNLESLVPSVQKQQSLTSKIQELENNIIVASWINDLGFPQKYEDDKYLFYNSEYLLNQGSLMDHFRRENSNFFSDKNVEFCCKKGAFNQIN